MALFHINVTGVHGAIDMNSLNYGFISALFFGAILYLLRKHRRKSLMFILRWLVCIAVYVGFLLEIYFMQQCPISKERYDNNKHILKEHVRALKEMGVPFTAADGTVLHVLRNSPPAPWDQDSDLLIIKPDEPQEFINEFKKHMGPEYVYKYEPDRGLLSSALNHAHGDIWLVNHLDNDKLMVDDYTTSWTLPKSVIFPPREIKWTGFDEDPLLLYLPNEAEEYAEELFGKNYMTPYYNRNQCIENFFTKTSSFTYWTIWASITAFSYLFYSVHENREIQNALLGLLYANGKSKTNLFGIQRSEADCNESKSFMHP